MPAPDLFQRIRVRHGHYCPMSTLGGRLGMAALSALEGGAGELRATYLIDTCAADGIAVATDCFPECDQLIIKNVGFHRLELRNAAGCGVCAELTATALERAAICRKRLDNGEDADEVLAELRSGPTGELIALKLLTGEELDA